MAIGAIIILAVLGAVLLFGIGIYNRLIATRNEFKNAFARIDVQLRRRYDLIPNLVETAKGYLAHEGETLEAVIQARNKARSAAGDASARPENGASIAALGEAEGALTGVMGRFFALAEAYPDLKADQSMQELMEELSGTENKIAAARQQFNDAGTAFNSFREQFPNNLVSALFSFDRAALLEIEDPHMRETPKLSFS